MNLVIDIGNTRLKAAIFDNDELIDFIKIPHSEKNQVLDILTKYKPNKAIISSVADASFNLNKELSAQNLDTLMFDLNTPLPIKVNYASDTIGLDRVADAVAAFSYSKAEHKLIIDAGTCITYNYIIGNEFLGGGISPGIHLRYKSLHHFTGRLPLIEKRDYTEIIGNSTLKSIQSGVINGIISEIQGICDGFANQYSETEIFITGGDGIFFAEGLKNSIFADPNLTLKGLNKILAFNER